MSSFMKRGQRQMVVKKNKEVKQHVKGFYKILGQIDEISKQLDPSIEYTEDNINEYVKPLFGRDLDSYEKFLILAKMYHETKDNN